jgi:3'(2'), 5'-bisphosphate nucleotidase
MLTELKNLIPSLLSLALQASEKILAVYYQEGAILVKKKTDDTPLTEADLLSHDTLLEGLQSLTPTYPVVSEESASLSFEQRQQWSRYWLIDPLDGTKEFIHRTDEFCINIALIENHKPILGMIYAPATGRCAYAIAGAGAFEIHESKHIPLHTKHYDRACVRLAMSRFHGEKKFLPFVQEAENYQIIPCGSALKFILVAAGEADVYLRFGQTSEWDTAAGQCIVEEAGGKVIDLQGNVLQYNTKESLLNPEFIVMGDHQHNWLD